MTGRYREWRRLLKAAVLAHLGPDYVIIAHEHMVGLASDIFTRKCVGRLCARIRGLILPAGASLRGPEKSRLERSRPEC